MSKLKHNRVEKPIEYMRKQIVEKIWSWNSNGDLTGLNEQIKEVKEKFTFMNDQKEDLMLAKNELISVISEMTEKMKEILFISSSPEVEKKINIKITH